MELTYFLQCVVKAVSNLVNLLLYKLYICVLWHLQSNNYGKFRGCYRNSYSSSAWVLVLVMDTQYSGFTAGSTCPHAEKLKLHHTVFFFGEIAGLTNHFHILYALWPYFQMYVNSIVVTWLEEREQVEFHSLPLQMKPASEVNWGRDRSVKMLNVYITPRMFPMRRRILQSKLHCTSQTH